jgi:uroporphyrinogen decarboxylase
VFNLGHGVPPETDPEVLARIVDLVHSESPRLRAEVQEQTAAGAR